ncbi:MAG TPA: hypothetical protein VN622_12010 [Clostridia bacterium]|nr:hypothetical protein [Clostridia bacterium]
MKKLAISLLLCSLPACAQTVPAAASSAQSTVPVAVTQNADPSAQKARALLEKMIAALGGQSYLTFQTKTEQGRTYGFYQGQPTGSGTQFWRFWKFPDKDRTELTKKRDVIYIVNGDQGYEKTYKGTAAQEPDIQEDYLRRRTHSLEVVLRQWLKQPGTMLFYDGAATVEQKLADQVSIVNAQNDSVTIAIDQTNSLPIRRLFTYRDRTDKLKNEDAEVYGNFRMIEGVNTPLTISRMKNGLMTNQRFLNEVHYNVPMPESMFEAGVTYDPYKLSGPRR